MFQNRLRNQDSTEVDPYAEMNGDQELVMPDQDDNPFGEIFAETDSPDPTGVNPEQHFVNPHYVEPYYREDGTYIEGHWRDGDGDTNVDHHVEEGGGYTQTNPDDDLLNNLDSGDGFEF